MWKSSEIELISRDKQIELTRYNVPQGSCGYIALYPNLGSLSDIDFEVKSKTTAALQDQGTKKYANGIVRPHLAQGHDHGS